MRSYIRHPSSVPLDFQLEELVQGRTDYLKNVSQGGLSFYSMVPLEPGSTIHLKIPLIKPIFEALGQVTWCNQEGNRFEIGVRFLDQDDMFRARMVEQICHIEDYKKKVYEQEGRRLTGEEAAKEWISKYAMDFPGSVPGS
jgi:hypothetical protein